MTYKFGHDFNSGLIWTKNEFTVGFQESIVKFFWKEEEFNCSSAFLNLVNDIGTCFTFNPGNTVADKIIRYKVGKNFKLFSEDFMFFIYYFLLGNGINLSAYDEKFFTIGT